MGLWLRRENNSYRKGLEAMDKVKDRQDETAKEEHAEEDQWLKHQQNNEWLILWLQIWAPKLGVCNTCFIPYEPSIFLGLAT